jgi:hypothetical protein
MGRGSQRPERVRLQLACDAAVQQGAVIRPPYMHDWLTGQRSSCENFALTCCGDCMRTSHSPVAVAEHCRGPSVAEESSFYRAERVRLRLRLTVLEIGLVCVFFRIFLERHAVRVWNIVDGHSAAG